MNANLNPVFADALAAFVKPGGPIDATPRKVADTTVVVDFRKLPARELLTIFRTSNIPATRLLAAEALIARQHVAKYGSESACYSDEQGIDWDLTYDVTGRYYPETDTDPEEFPEVTLRTAEISGWAIPLAALPASFRATLQEFCEEEAR